VLLSSENFIHRVDALNHFLDGVYRATLARLVLDDREHSALKTISFCALPEQLRAFLRKLEGDLRREIAALEETAVFEGGKAERYVLGLSLAAAGDLPDQ
jgi:hypothetical protein